MWWAILALASGHHVSIANSIPDLRICAASVERAADRQAEREGESLNVRLVRGYAQLFVDRLRVLGDSDAAALAAVKEELTGSAEERALMDKCGTIAALVRGDDTILEGAIRADATGDAADAAPTEPAVDPASEESAIDAAALLASLSAPLRNEVRCAMLAEAVRYDVNRGASNEDHGISDAMAGALGGRVASAIKAETGADDAAVRAIRKEEYEAYSFDLLGTGKQQAAIEKQFRNALRDCEPLFTSVR